MSAEGAESGRLAAANGVTSSAAMPSDAATGPSGSTSESRRFTIIGPIVPPPHPLNPLHDSPPRTGTRRRGSPARPAARASRRCRCPRARPRRARPISMPTSRVGVGRSEWSKRGPAGPRTAGTAAIRIAASEELTCTSPKPSSGHGTAISTAANTVSVFQRAARPAERAEPPRHREQHGGRDGEPRPRDEARRELVDRDLDEEVRHAPDHARPRRTASRRGRSCG